MLAFKTFYIDWCFWTVVLEKTLESPLNCKEIKTVNPKRNQSWIFIGRTDAEAEAPILWPLDEKNWLTGKAPDAGKDWWCEEKGGQRMTWLDGITDLMDMSLSRLQSWWWTGKSGVLQSMGLQRVGYDWATELNWTSSPRTPFITFFFLDHIFERLGLSNTMFTR